MVCSIRGFAARQVGKKCTALVLPGVFFLILVGFSSPQTFSANAAGWLDKVFGDHRLRTRRSYQRPRNGTSRRVGYKKAPDFRRYRPGSGWFASKTPAAYGIGRIDNVRSRAHKKKRRIYRIPKSGSSRYVTSSKTYRTMCVRSCDGYYFPVSFSTTKRHLKKDAEVCKSSCGVPASLYIYPNPGGEPEDMVSYKGKQKYQKLKNAFLFRKKFVADCRCKPDPWSKAARQKHLQYAKLERDKVVKQVASKAGTRKKRVSRWRKKNRRNHRKYIRSSRKRTARYIRTSGRKKARLRNKLPRRRYRIRRANRGDRWTF